MSTTYAASQLYFVQNIILTDKLRKFLTVKFKNKFNYSLIFSTLSSDYLLFTELLDLNLFDYLKEATEFEIKSSDRRLMGVVIPALSDNGFVNITLAMKVLSDDRLKKGLSPKKLNDIIKYDGFQEKCREIISRLENRDLCKRINISLQNKTLNLSDLNKMGLACRKGKGDGQMWYMNPYLFLVVAMEMSPEVCADVVMWFVDNIVGVRNAAGDAYIEMCSSVSSLISDKSNLKESLSRIAKGINFVVFGVHEEGIRNRASFEELDMIVSIERNISYAIKAGYIKDYNGVINDLGRQWKDRWGNPVLKLKS